MKRAREMSLEECARRMERFLNSSPRSGKTRAYLATLPKRARVAVSIEDYQPKFATARDAERYAAWVAGGKKPSPSIAPPKKADRRRPSAKSRSDQRALIERIVEYQLGRCLLCGSTMDLEADFATFDDRRPSFDHVLPRSLGGANEGNRLAAHRKCNSDKSNRRPTGCELVWLAAVNARLGIATPPPKRASLR